jgi:TctA family transporter
MLTEKLTLVFSMVWLIVISNIITVTICLLFLSQLAKITHIRGALLIPILLVLVFLGGYADTNSYLAMGITLLFGMLGLIMVHHGWPRPPLVLGLVLGPLIERNLFISYEIYGFGFLLRPLVLVIIVIALAVLFGPNIQEMITRRNRPKRERAIVANQE